MTAAALFLATWVTLILLTLLAVRGPVTLPGIAQQYWRPMSRAWALAQTLLRRSDLVRAAPRPADAPAPASSAPPQPSPPLKEPPYA